MYDSSHRYSFFMVLDLDHFNMGCNPHSNDPTSVFSKRSQ